MPLIRRVHMRGNIMKLSTIVRCCLILTIAAMFPFSLIAQTPAETTPAQSPAETTQRAASVAEYRIQVGDEIEVKSFYNPEINEKVTVRPDGRISVQLASDIPAAGKTPSELAGVLTQQYAAQFRQPEVTVILRTFAGQRIFVGGEVARPQTLELHGPMTALQAIAAAEGFRETAHTSQVILIRRDANLRPISTVMNLKDALNGHDPTQDTFLQPYDIVYVPKSKVANVNKWIDQVIRKNVPIPFSLSYRLNDQAGGE